MNNNNLKSYSNPPANFLQWLIFAVFVFRLPVDVSTMFMIELNQYDINTISVLGQNAKISFEKILTLSTMGTLLFYLSLILVWFHKLLAIVTASAHVLTSLIVTAFSGVYVGFPIEMTFSLVFYTLYVGTFSILLYESIEKPL